MPKIRDYLTQDSPFDLRSEGTSEGARKGWESRRGGSPGKEERVGERRGPSQASVTKHMSRYFDIVKDKNRSRADRQAAADKLHRLSNLRDSLPAYTGSPRRKGGERRQG